jgi:hypothetical protein
MSMQMRRTRNAKDEAPVAADQSPLKTRADILSEGAEAAKRGADSFIEAEQSRGRSIAGLCAAGGGIALAFAAAGALGYGEPRLMIVLSGLASLAPTALALARMSETGLKVKDSAVDRGLCQALSSHARRLGDSVGATDERNIALPADAVINAQIDLLYKDLDRAKQRLIGAGADLGPRTAAPRSGDRIVPDQAETAIVGSDGRRYPVWIVEVSLGSVTVRGSLPPMAQNETFHVGVRKAKVVGLAANRATFTFVTPIVASEFNRKIIL